MEGRGCAVEVEAVVEAMEAEVERAEGLAKEEDRRKGRKGLKGQFSR